MWSPDAVLFLISQQNLSARRQRSLLDALTATSPFAARLVRLEGNGRALPVALDELTGEGFRDILVQPVGLPFSESLTAWLPGALAHWNQSRPDIRLRFGTDQSSDHAVIAALVARSLAAADTAAIVDPAEARLGKPGWTDPPPFDHHILICTGPRCHFRDATTLRSAVADELARQRLSDRCLIAQTGCLFPCNRGPMLALYPAGEWYRLPTDEAVSRFVTEVIGKGESQPDLIIHKVSPTPTKVSS